MNVPVPVEQEVGRLDVAVDDSVTMRRIERRRRLLEPLERQADFLGTVLSDPLLERAAGQVLHDDEGPLRVLADVEDRDDVWLSGQPRRRQRFAREPLADRIVARIALGEHLDRDRAPERRIGCAVDLAHASARDALGRAVARREDFGIDWHAYEDPTV